MMKLGVAGQLHALKPQRAEVALRRRTFDAVHDRKTRDLHLGENAICVFSVLIRGKLPAPRPPSA